MKHGDCKALGATDQQNIFVNHPALQVALSEYIEEAGFLELHKIVLGFLPLNLRDALRTSKFTSQINHQTENDGTTPYLKHCGRLSKPRKLSIPIITTGSGFLLSAAIYRFLRVTQQNGRAESKL